MTLNVVPSLERSTSKPVSSVELSCHARSIRLIDTTVAVKPEGALGAAETEPDFRIVKVSRTTAVLSRNATFIWLVKTSITTEPRTLSERNIAGWFKGPPDVWPEEPATV